MRVLVITSSYPSHSGDPRGSFIRILTRAMADDGMEVIVLAPGAAGAPSQETDGMVSIHRATYWLPKRQQALATGLGGIVPNLRQRPWLIIQLIPLIVSLVLKAWRLAGRVDIVHAHWLYPAGLAGIAAARRARVPLVVTSHGGDLNLSHRSWVLRTMSRWVAERSDSCVGVSHAMVDEFRKLGVPEQQITFIPLGVNATRPASNEPSHSTAFQEFKKASGFRIVYVGSLIPRKSVDTLINAHHRLSERGHQIATLVVGAGPEGDRLRSLVERRGVRNVTFAGRQPPFTIPEWIALGDVLVLPSRSEGRGMVLVEAMALGIPIVASDIPGPQELINNGANGLLFRPGDAAALADQLERLIQEPDLGSRLRDNGRRYVEAEGLTPEVCARRHSALYRRLVDR